MSWLVSMIPAAVWRWGAIIGAGVLGLLTILNLRARLSRARRGKREAEQRVRTMREAREIGYDVDAMDDDAVHRDLSRWMR